MIRCFYVGVDAYESVENAYVTVERAYASVEDETNDLNGIFF